MTDPNKEIFLLDPRSRPEDYWGENLLEVKDILSVKSFDEGRVGHSVSSKQAYWKYTIDQIIDKDGLWLEFGVWKGESLRYISSFTDQPVYGFDSFEANPGVIKSMPVSVNPLVLIHLLLKLRLMGRKLRLKSFRL